MSPAPAATNFVMQLSTEGAWASAGGNARVPANPAALALCAREIGVHKPQAGPLSRLTKPALGNPTRQW